MQIETEVIVTLVLANTSTPCSSRRENRRIVRYVLVLVSNHEAVNVPHKLGGKKKKVQSDISQITSQLLAGRCDPNPTPRISFHFIANLPLL
jgi:hypothetical protein